MLERINLVPKRPLAEKLRTVVPVVIISLLSLIILAVYLQNRYLLSSIDRITGETDILLKNQAEASADLAKLRGLAGELEVLQKQKQSLAEEVDKIESIQGRKRGYANAINAIATALPDSLKCEKIIFNGRSGVIEGRALNHLDLPLVVEKLAVMPVFTSSSLKDVDTITDVVSAPLSFRILVEMR